MKTKVKETHTMEAQEIHNPKTETSQELPTSPGHAPMQIPEHLNQNQALQILVDAARAAQSKGIFSLEDAELVSRAIKAFMPPPGPGPSMG